jgi:hypothetical protein
MPPSKPQLSLLYVFTTLSFPCHLSPLPSQREWESYVVPDYPYHKVLGRIRNLDVELFVNDPDLEAELLSLDYTVRPFDRNKRMSIYADTEFKDRTLLQKLQDQLYEVLRDDGVDVAYGLVTETQSDWVLITKLDRVSLQETRRIVYRYERQIR